MTAKHCECPCGGAKVIRPKLPTQQKFDYYTPYITDLTKLKAAALAAKKDALDEIYHSPKILDKIFHGLNIIPVFGQVLDISWTLTKKIQNAINKPIDDQSHKVADAWQSVADYAQRQINSARDLGPVKFNAKNNKITQKSVSHRQQLINSGFYDKRLAAEAASGATLGAGLSTPYHFANCY